MAQPITNLILDMDGVLWRGETPIPGLVDFFADLRRGGIGFVLATNNAGKTAAMFAEKLARFGVDVPPDQILTSAEATASHMAEQYPLGSPVYIVGARGLFDAMTERGFRPVTPREVRNGATAAFVVVGYTPDATYEDLAMGALLVHRGVPFVGTNPDPSLPTELGPMPGAGALIAVISTTTGVQPLLVGKPGPIVFAEAVKRLGADPASVAMVGDRISTDIAGAKAAGLRAVLVLTGISTLDEALASPIKPDYIFDDITALAHFLTEEQALASA